MDMSWMIAIALCAVPLLAVITYRLWREECESASGEDAADWLRAEDAHTRTQKIPPMAVRETASDRTLEYA